MHTNADCERCKEIERRVTLRILRGRSEVAARVLAGRVRGFPQGLCAALGEFDRAIECEKKARETFQIWRSEWARVIF